MTYRVQPVGLRNPGENTLYAFQSSEFAHMLYVRCDSRVPAPLLSEGYYLQDLNTGHVISNTLGLRRLAALKSWMRSKEGQDWLTVIA